MTDYVDAWPTARKRHRAAQAAYARERRKNAEVRGEEKRQDAARTRTYVQLSPVYPTLPRALYEEELRRTT